MSKYNRVLLKLSGEALSGSKGFGFDEAVVLEVGRQVKKSIEKGIQIGVVIGGGNIWRGRSCDHMDRVKADQIGMMATVINALYVAEIFRTIGLKTVVQTPFKIGTVTEEFSKDATLGHLNNGSVVFFAGGTGHPMFSTDTAAALRAIEIEADVILLAKNIDGIYDDDPKTNPNARKYDHISLKEIIDKKLKALDLTAAIMCLENHMPMIVFGLCESNGITLAMNGETSGTVILDNE